MDAKGVDNSVGGPWTDGELIFNLFRMINVKFNDKSHDSGYKNTVCAFHSVAKVQFSPVLPPFFEDREPN
jgi:hypothetical protein